MMNNDLLKKGKLIFQRIKDDRLSLVAAGVAFFIFLSIFPAIASSISIYGLVADPQDVREHMSRFSQVLPSEVITLLQAQIERFSASENSKLSIGLVVGIFVSLWGANKAMKAVAQALNIAHDVKEDRNFIKLNVVTLALTFFSSLVFCFTFAVLIVVPVIVTAFLKASNFEWLVLTISWALLAAIVFGIFTILYRKAPALHGEISSRELLPGALLATFLLLLGSAAFSIYIVNFGKYDAQYGTLASVVITMLWLYLGAFIFLVGAEINAVLNAKQTDRLNNHEVT